MAFSIQNIVHKILKTHRLTDITDTIYDYLLNDFRPEYVDIIKKRLYKEQMTTDLLKDFAKDRGWNLTIEAGYTSTNEYLLKEISTIVPRILTKTTIDAYKYTFYIFNLIGKAYPLLIGSNNRLEPWIDWLSTPETDVSSYQLDTGLVLDQGGDRILRYEALRFDTGLRFDSGIRFDTMNPVLDGVPEGTGWKLDDPDFTGVTTRHILINYEQQFIDSATDFMESLTAKAFYNDIYQIKKATEIIHYQPRLSVFGNINNTLLTTTYTSETGTYSASQKTLLIGTDFSDIATIKFGDSAHTTIDASITNVANEVHSMSITDFSIELQDLYDLYITEYITATSVFPSDFSEIALLDSGGNCVLYSTFPYIRFDSNMLSTVQLYCSLT